MNCPECNSKTAPVGETWNWCGHCGTIVSPGTPGHQPPTTLVPTAYARLEDIVKTKPKQPEKARGNQA